MQVTTALLKSGAVKLSELCPSAGKVAWLAHLDVYILAADGAMLDAVLLAAVACLASLTIPVVPLTPQGTVRPLSPATVTAGSLAVAARHLLLSLGPWPWLHARIAAQIL